MKRSRIEDECFSRSKGFNQTNFGMNKTGSMSSNMGGLETAGTNNQESRMKSTFYKSYNFTEGSFKAASTTSNYFSS